MANNETTEAPKPLAGVRVLDVATFVAAPFADPMSVGPANWGLLFLLGFVVMPLSFGLITLGPRTLPAPEVALLLLLETVLGPLWVWVVINEIPSELTFIGGVVVISAVVLQSVWRLSPSRSTVSSGKT